MLLKLTAEMLHISIATGKTNFLYAVGGAAEKRF